MQAWLVIEWDISSTTLKGPYPDKETAREIAEESETEHKGVLGPIEFEEVK